MGVYIKDVKMPACCDECPLHEVSWGNGEDTHFAEICKALNHTFNDCLYGKGIEHRSSEGRLDDCPLVEITEPL